jgi:hypothetical protein
LLAISFVFRSESCKFSSLEHVSELRTKVKHFCAAGQVKLPAPDQSPKKTPQIATAHRKTSRSLAKTCCCCARIVEDLDLYISIPPQSLALPRDLMPKLSRTGISSAGLGYPVDWSIEKRKRLQLAAREPFMARRG